MRIGTLQAHLRARAAVYRRRAKLGRIARAALRRLSWLLVGIALSPLAPVLHLLGVRRLTLGVTHIGHLAVEPDCFLKARALGELPNRRWFFLAPRGMVANEHLLSYWTPHIPAVRHPLVGRAVASMITLGLMTYDVSRYVLRYDRGADIYRLNARWGDRPPLLELTSEDEDWAQEMLSRLGLPAGAWFVCVHAREPSFLPEDELIQRYRNSNPLALIPAIQEITARGGWCIRMGDPSSQPLPPIEGLVDYAHHPLRSPRLDVILCARTTFFLGNTSGISLLSSVFGRPVLRANAVPLSALAPGPADLSLLKLYWSRRERRLLRFDEVLGTPAASYRYASQFDAAGIEVRENSAEEIAEAAVEMLDVLNGARAYTPEEEELHRRFMSLLRPRDYGYGAASRVSASFLRAYSHLLP
jgi:putative glycosyltransferase (TIGR04372 family)